MKGSMLALVLWLGALGWAQEPERPPGLRAREEAGRMVEGYIIANLQERLAISDEQFVKLLPLVRRQLGDRRDFFHRREDVLREVRALLGTASEGRIADLMKTVRSLEAEEATTLRRDTEAIDALLTPVQQAKFRILELEVERRIRDLRGQLRLRQGPGAQRPPGLREPPQ